MVTIRTVKATPEGEVIQTMEVQPEEKWEPLKAVIKEKARKFKTLGELTEGFMYDVSEKSKKTSKEKKAIAKSRAKKIKARTAEIKRVGGVIERMYKRGRVEYQRARPIQKNRQLAIQKEKTRQLQIQLQIRAQEANRVASEQRVTYETPVDYPDYEQQGPQIEEDYSQQTKPSMVQDIFNKLRPKPGILQRLGGMASPQNNKSIRNSAQIGTRHIAGDGPLIKAPQMVAPQISILGGEISRGGTSRGNQGVQPNVLNAQKLSFFSSQLNKPKDTLRW